MQCTAWIRLSVFQRQHCEMDPWALFTSRRHFGELGWGQQSCENGIVSEAPVMERTQTVAAFHTFYSAGVQTLSAAIARSLTFPTFPHRSSSHLYSTVDIRLRVSGGGHTSQIYAIRQAIAKSLVAYYAKYYDAASALELRQLFVAYDRTLLIADTRRSEPKKFGGHGARARRQKSYR